MTPKDQYSASSTSDLATKKYGRSGMKPPKKYPPAMVKAQVIAREPAGSGSVCWKCMRNCTRCGDFVRWKARSLVRFSGRSKGANTSEIDAADVEGALATSPCVDESVAW